MPDGSMTNPEIEAIVEKAFKKALIEVLDDFGLNVTTSEGRQELRADISWLRDTRKGTALVRKTALVGMITTFISGAAFGLWTVISWIANRGTPGH